MLRSVRIDPTSEANANAPRHLGIHGPGLSNMKKKNVDTEPPPAAGTEATLVQAESKFYESIALYERGAALLMAEDFDRGLALAQWVKNLRTAKLEGKLPASQRKG